MQTRRSSSISLARKFGLVVTLAGLLLAVLMTSNVESAQAQSVDEPVTVSCPQDATLENGLCRVPVEPIQVTVVEPVCPPGSQVDGSTCVVVSDVLTADNECPFGAFGVSGDCYVVESADLQCSVGVLAGDTCVVNGPAPTSGPATCPVGPNVFLDGAFCYFLDGRSSDDCTSPAILGPDGCRQPAALVPGALACEPTFALIAGECIRFETPVAGPCAPGTVEDAFGQCRRPVDDRQDRFFCEPGGVLVGADQCRYVVDIDCTYATVIVGCSPDQTQCPDPFVVDLGGRLPCLLTEDAAERPSVCPTGSRGAPGGCYILVAKGPSSDGTEPQCPNGSVEDPAGDCRKPVATALGDRFCESPFASLGGVNCFTSAAATTPCQARPQSSPDACASGSVCPTGFSQVGPQCERLAPAIVSSASCSHLAELGPAGNCYRYVEHQALGELTCVRGTLRFDRCEFETGPPIGTEFTCPISTSVFEEDGECFFLVTNPDECTGILTVHPSDPTVCRQAIRRIPAPICASGSFRISSDGCGRRESPVPSGGFACSSEAFEDDLGRCRVPSNTRSGARYCENPNARQPQFGSTCTELLAAFTTQCPDGFSPDDSLGGTCARFEPASFDSTPRCPEGARGVPGECFILIGLSPFVPVCAEGTFDGSASCVTSQPPVGDPPTCPDGFMMGSRDCVRLTSPEFAPGCLSGTVEVADGCRRDVADAPTEYFCEDPSARLRFESCIFTADPVVTCTLTADLCSQSRVVSVCPPAAYSDGDSCFALQCPAGFDPGNPPVCVPAPTRPAPARAPAQPAADLETADETNDAVKAVAAAALTAELPQQTTLAITGLESDLGTLLGLSLLGGGATLAGLSRVRTRKLANRSD